MKVDKPTYAPATKIAPWAKFNTSIRPKIRDNPEATKKYKEAKVIPESRIDIHTLVSMLRVKSRIATRAIAVVTNKARLRLKNEVMVHSLGRAKVAADGFVVVDQIFHQSTLDTLARLNDGVAIS